MTRLEILMQAIAKIPDDAVSIRDRLQTLAGKGDWLVARSYAVGVKDTLDVFTSEEEYLKPLRTIVEILK